jgi:hypothetical protein
MPSPPITATRIEVVAEAGIESDVMPVRLVVVRALAAVVP